MHPHYIQSLGPVVSMLVVIACVHRSVDPLWKYISCWFLLKHDECWSMYKCMVDITCSIMLGGSRRIKSILLSKIACMC